MYLYVLCLYTEPFTESTTHMSVCQIYLVYPPNCPAIHSPIHPLIHPSTDLHPDIFDIIMMQSLD